MSDHSNRSFQPEMRKKFLKVIRHNHYLDLGNGSNKFGNHWLKTSVHKHIFPLMGKQCIED